MNINRANIFRRLNRLWEMQSTENLIEGCNWYFDALKSIKPHFPYMSDFDLAGLCAAANINSSWEATVANCRSILLSRGLPTANKFYEDWRWFKGIASKHTFHNGAMKSWQFAMALLGYNAVVLDRWMSRAMLKKDAKLNPASYSRLADVFRAWCDKVSPYSYATTQAIIWCVIRSNPNA